MIKNNGFHARRFEILGPELIKNGDFSQGSTDWSLDNVVIAAGIATLTAAVDTASIAQNSAIPVVGRKYKYSITILSSSGAGVRVQLGGALSPILSTPGTYTGYLTPTSTNRFDVRRAGLTTTAFDNISVRPA
jgi:hypothetical protein